MSAQADRGVDEEKKADIKAELRFRRLNLAGWAEALPRKTRNRKWGVDGWMDALA